MERRKQTTEIPPPVPSASSVILVCPCCASPVDAEVMIEIQQLSCGTCGQDWHMQVDVSRLEAYALT